MASTPFLHEHTPEGQNQGPSSGVSSSNNLAMLLASASNPVGAVPYVLGLGASDQLKSTQANKPQVRASIHTYVLHTHLSLGLGYIFFIYVPISTSFLKYQRIDMIYVFGRQCSILLLLSCSISSIA